MMNINTAAIVLLAAVVALAAWWLLRRRGGTRREALTRPIKPPRELYTQVGVSRTYKQAVVPRPSQDSPLSALLARAVDVAVPMPSSGEAVPHDQQEVKALFTKVLDRVNAKNPGLAIALVSVDNVRKTVDQYKSIRYEAELTVYAKARNITSKVAAAADLASDGTLFVRALKVHGAERDDADAQVKPSNGIGTEEQYAAFEPAVKY